MTTFLSFPLAFLIMCVYNHPVIEKKGLRPKGDQNESDF